MQEQYPFTNPEQLAQPTVELDYEETSSRTTEKLEAMRRLIDETYADLLAEDDELAAEVAAIPDVVEVAASPEVLTPQGRIERIGSNLAYARRER